MEISKAAHFWKDYNVRNQKNHVYICADARMTTILNLSKKCLFNAVDKLLDFKNFFIEMKICDIG